MATLFRNKTPEAENFPADDGTEPIYNSVGEERGHVPKQKPKKGFWDFFKSKNNPEEVIIYGSSLLQEETVPVPVDSNSVAESSIVKETVQPEPLAKQKPQKKRLREKAEKKRLREEQSLLDNRPSKKAPFFQEITHATAPEFKSEASVLELTPKEEVHLGNIVAEELTAIGLQAAVHNPEISTDAKLSLSSPEAQAEMANRVKKKVFFKRPSVHQMVEFFGGMAAGATYKTLASGGLKKAIKYAGVAHAGSSWASLGMSAGIGAAVGASWEVGKTIVQENRRVKLERSGYKQELEGLLGADRLEALLKIRSKEDLEAVGLDDFSREILEKHNKVKISGKKLIVALRNGAIIGGLGGVIGGYIAEKFMHTATAVSAAAEHGQAIHETVTVAKETAQQSFEVAKTDVTQEMHKTVWNTVKQWYIDHGVPKENINNKLVERGVEHLAGLDNIEITGHHGAPGFSGFEHMHFDEGVAGAVKDIHMHEGDVLHHMESLNDIVEEAGGNPENLNVTVNYPTGLPGVPVPHVDAHEAEGLGYETFRNIAIGTLTFGGAAYGLLRRRKKQPEQAAEILEQTTEQPTETISDGDIIEPQQNRYTVEESFTAPEHVADVAPTIEQIRTEWNNYIDEALNPWGDLIDRAEDSFNEGRLDECRELLNEEYEAWEELQRRSEQIKNTAFAGDIDRIYGPVVSELTGRVNDLNEKLTKKNSDVPEPDNSAVHESLEKQQRVEGQLETLAQIFQGAHNMVLDAEDAFAKGHVDLAGGLLNEAWKPILRRDKIPPDLEADIEPMYNKLWHEFSVRANALEQQIDNTPTALPQAAAAEQPLPQVLVEEPVPAEIADDEEVHTGAALEPVVPVVPGSEPVIESAVADALEVVAPEASESTEANKEQILQETVYKELEDKFEAWKQYLENSFAQKLKVAHDANDYEGYDSVIEEQSSLGSLALWESEGWMERFGTDANKAQELAEQWDQANERKIGKLVDRAFKIKKDFEEWYEARPKADAEVQPPSAVINEQKQEEKELDKKEFGRAYDVMFSTFDDVDNLVADLDKPHKKGVAALDIVNTTPVFEFLSADSDVKEELRSVYEIGRNALIKKLLDTGHEDVARQVWDRVGEGEFPSISQSGGEKVERDPEESVPVESAPQAQATTKETERLVGKTKEQERGSAIERITRAAIESGVNLEGVKGNKYGELLLSKEYGGQLWKAKLSEVVALGIQERLREVKDWKNISDFDRESLKEIFILLDAPKYKNAGIKRVVGELSAIHPVLKELADAARKIKKLK